MKSTVQILIRTSPKWILWAFAMACFGVFIEVFGELHESQHDDSDLLEVDAAITKFLFSLRTPVLNHVAVDVTALGSTVIITSIVVFLTVVFAMRRKKYDALQIAVAGLSAGIFSQGFKYLVGRDRPPLESRLVEVSGYSYPSGHSLTASVVYLTIGLIFFERYHDHKERIFCLASMIVLISAIGASRIYLGVHYPSDVAGGIALGMGLAFLIFAIRRIFELRSRDQIDANRV